MRCLLRRWTRSRLPSVAFITLTLLTLLTGSAFGWPAVGETDEDLYRCAQEALEKTPQDCVAATLCLNAYIDRTPDAMKDPQHRDAVLKSWQGCTDQLTDAIKERGRSGFLQGQLNDLVSVIEKYGPEDAISDMKNILERQAPASYQVPWLAPLLGSYPARSAPTDSLLCLGGGKLALTYYNWSDLSTKPHILATFEKAATPPRVYDASGKLVWMLKPGQCELASDLLDSSESNVLLLADPVLPPDQFAIAWSKEGKAMVLHAPAITRFLMQQHYAQFSVYNDGLGHWVVTSMEPFYDVKMESTGCRSGEVIQAVMANAGLRLEDAKALVEAGRGATLTAVSFGEAQTAALQLTKAGAKVSVVDGTGAAATLPSDDSGPFLFPIEDVFEIAGRGTIVTGRVQRGQVRPGDTVEIVGLGTARRIGVTALEQNRQSLNEGRTCDQIGVLLSGVSRQEVERGQVLSTPGAIAAHTRFEAQIAVLTRAEGGKSTPVFNGYRPQFVIRTALVTGEIRLTSGVDMVLPGKTTTIEVTLIADVALEEGAPFAVVDGGRDVAYGVVTKIIE